MNLEQCIAQARQLSNGSTIKWCVIKRADGRHTLKIIGGTLNGHRLGIDYQPTEIVWTPLLP